MVGRTKEVTPFGFILSFFPKNDIDYIHYCKRGITSDLFQQYFLCSVLVKMRLIWNCFFAALQVLSLFSGGTGVVGTIDGHAYNCFVTNAWRSRWSRASLPIQKSRLCLFPELRVHTIGSRGQSGWLAMRELRPLPGPPSRCSGFQAPSPPFSVCHPASVVRHTGGGCQRLSRARAGHSPSSREARVPGQGWRSLLLSLRGCRLVVMLSAVSARGRRS